MSDDEHDHPPLDDLAAFCREQIGGFLAFRAIDGIREFVAEVGTLTRDGESGGWTISIVSADGKQALWFVAEGDFEHALDEAREASESDE